MGYRKWKPNATQRRAYAERMREQEAMKFVHNNGPIREGCELTWVDKSTSEQLSGKVINSSYGKETNQHTFTIQLDSGGIKMVKGRNLYDRLLSHIPGEQSLLDYGKFPDQKEVRKSKGLSI